MKFPRAPEPHLSREFQPKAAKAPRTTCLAWARTVARQCQRTVSSFTFPGRTKSNLVPVLLPVSVSVKSEVQVVARMPVLQRGPVLPPPLFLGFSLEGGKDKSSRRKIPPTPPIPSYSLTHSVGSALPSPNHTQ